MPIIQGKVLEGSTIHTDGWKAYDGLILNGYNPFQSWAKRRFAKFNGLNNETFLLLLKETECRFNHGDDNIEYEL